MKAKTKRTKEEKKRLVGFVTAGILTLLACVVFFATIWFLINYDDIRLDQVLYQMKAPAEGTPASYTIRAVGNVGIWSISLTAALIYCVFIAGKFYPIFTPAFGF